MSHQLPTNPKPPSLDSLRVAAVALGKDVDALITEMQHSGALPVDQCRDLRYERRREVIR